MINNILRKFLILSLITLMFTVSSCFSVKYSMTGASISPEIKTLSVQLFENRAPNVRPSMGQEFTEALRRKCRSQTSLKIIRDVGDVNFEGEITDCGVQSVAIQSNDKAAQDRFSITIRVKFTNSVDPTQSFDQSFTRYKDYSSSQNASEAENKLTPELIDLLTEDVFNKAFANW